MVSIEGSVIKPDTLPRSGLSVLFKYPVFGDLFILMVRSGWLNRAFLPLIAGRWYPHMTPADRQEMLEQLSFNTRSATRHAWYAIDRSVQTSRDMEEEAKTLQVPTLYIYGTANEDFKPMIDANLAFFARYLPCVQVADISEGIHDSAFQQPDEVSRLIRKFLGPTGEG
jgi:pimeloyl-ACP methyl ester carboxylesterase